MSTKYVTIKLPQDVIDEIDQLVGKKGYSSRTEVVKDAMRRFLENSNFQEQKQQIREDQEGA